MSEQASAPYITIDFTVTDSPLRLDQILAAHYPEFSRSRWQSAIRCGDVRLNGETVKPKTVAYPGDRIEGQISLTVEAPDPPQKIDFPVLYSDEDIIVINKPAGLVVHPAAGNADQTLLNGLLYHFPATQKLPRAGIVHRLDKDTSGVMVVAHNLQAHTHLVRQLQDRSMGREYLALAQGHLTAGGTVEEPIARHPQDRLRMAVRSDGKPAITHFRLEERFPGLTLLRVKLETGRTHQIRVHMAYLKHPLIGDRVYGNPGFLPKNLSAQAREALSTFSRQALHAETLTLIHPRLNTLRTYSAPCPQDMQSLLDTLARENKS